MIHKLCELEAIEQYSRAFPDNYTLADFERLHHAACELAERLRRRVAYLRLQAAGGEG
jgi:hypothetical protein